MLTELETEQTPLVNKCSNYIKFSVIPIFKDNLFMIVSDDVNNCHSKTEKKIDVIEVIFEVSLN